MKFSRRRFFKRAALGLAFLVGVALVINGIADWLADRRLSARIAEFHAANEPVSVDELKPASIAPETNAATYLERVALQTDAFEKDLGAFFETPAGKALEEIEEKEAVPTAEQLIGIQEILHRHSEILPAITQAASCEQYVSFANFPLPVEQFDEGLKKLVRIRYVARYVHWKSFDLMSQSQPSEAVRLQLQLLHLATMFGHNASFTQYLLSIALQAYVVDDLNHLLRAATVSPEVHAEVDRELGRADDPVRLVQSLKAERAVNISFFRENQVRSPFGGHIFFWRDANWLCDLLGYFDKVIPAASRPWYQSRSDPIWENPSVSLRGHASVYIVLLAPPTRAAYITTARTTAYLRCLRILNALVAYRATNGREAEKLGDLDLPVEAVLDPFSGKPLLLMKTDQGWVIYSVGENQIDDHGAFKELEDWGLGPAGYPHR